MKIIVEIISAIDTVYRSCMPPALSIDVLMGEAQVVELLENIAEDYGIDKLQKLLNTIKD